MAEVNPLTILLSGVTLQVEYSGEIRTPSKTNISPLEDAFPFETCSFCWEHVTFPGCTYMFNRIVQTRKFDYILTHAKYPGELVRQGTIEYTCYLI